VILTLSVVQAIDQDSLAPIWMVGWLPAVVVASLSARSSRKRCSVRSSHIRRYVPGDRR